MNQFIRRNSSLVDVDFARVLRSETRAPLEGAENSDGVTAVKLGMFFP